MPTFTIIFIVIVGLSALGAFGRGLAREGFNLAGTIISTVIAAVITGSLGDRLVNAFKDIPVREIVEGIKDGIEPEGAITPEIENFLLSLDPQMIEYSAAFTTVLYITFIFAALFLVVSIVVDIIMFILRFVLRIPKMTSITGRVGGLVLGAINGLIISVVLLLPFANLSGVLREANEIMSSEDEVIADEMEEDGDDLLSDPMLIAIENMGGRQIYEGLCTVKVDGESYNLRDEAIVLVKTAYYALELSEVEDFKAPNEVDQERITAVIDTLGTSKYLSTIVAGAMRALATTSEALITVEDPYDDIINAAVSIFECSTHETLIEDLNTVKSVYFIAADGGVWTEIHNGGKNLASIMTARDENGDTVISKIIAAIEDNERAGALITEIAKLSVGMLSDELGITLEATEIYENIKEEMPNILAAESTEEMVKELTNVLEENAITIDDEIINDMVDYIETEHGDVSEISDEELNYILLHYYDAYLAMQEN